MKHLYRLLSAAAFTTLLPLMSLAQTPGVGIGTTAPDISAALDIVSSTKGALLPRVPNATTLATPATGLLVFQTGAPAGFYYNAGTPGAPSWQQIATAAGAAVTAGNGLTKTGNNIALGGTLAGTTTIATAGFNLGLTGSGNLGIGTSTPLTRLSISPGAVEPKITLYDAGSATNHYGFGVSSFQLNYHVAGTTDNHVFWAGGKNGTGTELLRIVVNLSSNTLQVFNVINPASPVLVGSVATGSNPKNVAVSGATAYVVSEGSRTLQAFTISTSPRVVAVNPDGSLGSVALLSGTDFIQNGTALQIGASFNIGGSAVVGGNVGIGTSTAPAAKLEVVGDVRIPAANSYTYASARAKTVLLGAFDFRAENGTAATTLDGNTDELFPTAAAGGVFRAPLHLPQGAILTGFTLLAYDGVAANVTAELISYVATGGTVNRTTLATAGTTGTPNNTAVPSGAIATTVDNDNLAYSVRVTFGAGNTNLLTLRGVKVSYTIARVE